MILSLGVDFPYPIRDEDIVDPEHARWTEQSLAIRANHKLKAIPIHIERRVHYAHSQKATDEYGVNALPVSATKSRATWKSNEFMFRVATC